MKITDPYIGTNAAYNRLERDYLKFGSLTIGLDFDGTIYDYHKLGYTHEKVIKLVQDLHFIGCKIVVWTCNNDIDFVKLHLHKKNIPYDGINTDGIYLGWGSRKPFFSALLDDRAGLDSVYRDLKKLVDKYKKHASKNTTSNNRT